MNVMRLTSEYNIVVLFMLAFTGLNRKTHVQDTNVHSQRLRL